MFELLISGFGYKNRSTRVLLKHRCQRSEAVASDSEAHIPGVLVSRRQHDSVLCRMTEHAVKASVLPKIHHFNRSPNWPHVRLSEFDIKDTICVTPRHVSYCFSFI